jgi:hypothetical protein
MQVVETLSIECGEVGILQRRHHFGLASANVMYTFRNVRNHSSIITTNMANAGKAHQHLNGKFLTLLVTIANMTVMRKPLGGFAKNTGFYRNGSCEVGPEDSGNHSVAGPSSFPA